jgi:oligopeptide/dipeptide ABC transporter ATP-binding protein
VTIIARGYYARALRHSIYGTIDAYEHKQMNELLDVHNLTVELPTARGWVRPVNDVTLRIDAGESLGLVGESGSGKTMMALALMGLLPPGARVSGEAILTPAHGREQNLTTLDDARWRRLRGLDVAMIFQEPMTSLNPVMRVGEQIAEAMTAHFPKIGREKIKHWVPEALRLAAVPEPAARSEQYPHQLSGGLRQRVMIAMAIVAGLSDPESEITPLEYRKPNTPLTKPRLLIADEPTTALDVTVQKQILDLLDGLRRRLGLGLLFITHDLGVVAQVADRVAVMYAGRIVEEGRAVDVLRGPRHPYTQGLIAASPTLERGKLSPIPGTVPQLTELPPGCSFEPRCSLRLPECRLAVPELRDAGNHHAARCVLLGREAAVK